MPHKFTHPYAKHLQIGSCRIGFPAIFQPSANMHRCWNKGFQVTYAALFDRPTPLKGETGLADWIQMFIKEPFVGLSVDLQAEIVDETVEALRPSLYKNGIWIADYVRLRCKAIKK